LLGTRSWGGPDATAAPGRYRKATSAVGRATRLQLRLGPGGGFAAHIRQG